MHSTKYDIVVVGAAIVGSESILSVALTRMP